VSLELLSYKI